ncbi:hypothetical protein KCG44_03120 [Pacificimonas sp. WHA3]|uniref:Uncharacterized protein n=1 Tax=Pacificimonas pallii TaxID=2827236 RepID=A0ABS6SBH7_9SPHN|nr:DUF6489 family protein [Pacificimonas pallii]MBV7255773.1 hypothetical protein [Pacificimonas pallii]
MKVNIKIGCTPEEARAFFGLPDLSPVHEAYVARMTRFAEEGLTQADIESAMQNWMSGMTALGGASLSDLQKMMFPAMGTKSD